MGEENPYAAPRTADSPPLPIQPARRRDITLKNVLCIISCSIVGTTIGLILNGGPLNSSDPLSFGFLGLAVGIVLAIINRKRSQRAGNPPAA